MLVCEIMKKRLISLNSNETVLDAYKKYRDNKVGSLIVVDSDRCIGIVTERDLIEKAIDKDIKTTMVKEIMSANVKTISQFDNIETASKMMHKFNIKKPAVRKNRLL